MNEEVITMEQISAHLRKEHHLVSEVIVGLGEDNKMYWWDERKEKWVLYHHKKQNE